MKYNFDEIIDRRNTNSRKWCYRGMHEMAEYVDENSLPMWVADMDFKSPDIIIDSLTARVQHGILGYSMSDDSYLEAIKFWNKIRRNIDVETDWIMTFNGVLNALNLAVKTMSEPGDGVIIQPPVYHHFSHCILNNNRKIVKNRLINDNGDYKINFEELEKLAADPKNKVMIFCNPHNPVGRVWSREEVEKVLDICYRNDVFLVSDEIHSDILLFGNVFTSAGAVDNKYLNNLIVCTSMSKSFNVAALKIAHIIVPNPSVREKFFKEFLSWGEMPYPNLFGLIATKAAYTIEGDEWLKAVISYLEENYRYMDNFLKENLPQIKLGNIQASYLAWMDFSGTGLTHEEVKSKIEQEAKIVIDGGEVFGEEGRGFIRLNFACPKSVMEEAMFRLLKAFKA